jgi:hypothetical protein
LHDAQLAIARQQGFASWPRFKAFIVESQLDFQGLVTAFIDAAVSDGRSAKEIMAAHPQIANAGLYAALVLGDWKQVESALAATLSRNTKAVRKTASLCSTYVSPATRMENPIAPPPAQKPLAYCCGMAPIPTLSSFLKTCPTSHIPACTVRLDSTTIRR